MAKTRADLVNEALSQLKVVGAGQSASAEDYAAVDGKVDAVLAELAVRNVATIPNLNDIPLEVFLPVATCLAAACAGDFEVDRATLPDGRDVLAVGAETRLRSQRRHATSRPLKVDFF